MFLYLPRLGLGFLAIDVYDSSARWNLHLLHEVGPEVCDLFYGFYYEWEFFIVLSILPCYSQQCDVLICAKRAEGIYWVYSAMPGLCSVGGLSYFGADCAWYATGRRATNDGVVMRTVACVAFLDKT